MAVAESQQGLDEIKDEDLTPVEQDSKRQKKDDQSAHCDSCVIKHTTEQMKNVALYLCYNCELYLCEMCFKDHESHDTFSAVGEVNSRERKRGQFLSIMLNEEDKEAEFEKEHISLCNRVKVKHSFDKSDSYITGLCGLGHHKWVACDLRNMCIKIFEVQSNKLQHYIRLGSQPRDVTEIKLHSSPDKSESKFSSESATPITNPSEHDKQWLMEGSLLSNPSMYHRQSLTEDTGIPKVNPSTCDKQFFTEGKSTTNSSGYDKPYLVAVTLPRLCKIIIINISTTPADRFKVIKTEKFCYSIEYFDNKIFTTCDEYPGFRYSLWSVYIMSLDGETLRNIKTDIRYTPYLSVSSRRVYLTDYKNKIQCVSHNGDFISDKRIDGSGFRGVCVDPNDNVYVCAADRGKIYKLTGELDQYGLLLDQPSVFMKRPQTLTFFRDKLYISYDLPPIHANFVDVIRIM